MCVCVLSVCFWQVRNTHTHTHTRFHTHIHTRNCCSMATETRTGHVSSSSLFCFVCLFFFFSSRVVEEESKLGGLCGRRAGGGQGGIDCLFFFIFFSSSNFLRYRHIHTLGLVLPQACSTPPTTFLFGILK